MENSRSDLAYRQLRREIREIAVRDTVLRRRLANLVAQEEREP